MFKLLSNTLIALLFFLATYSISSQATLIDNGLYTTDSDTGLDWLDLTETGGYNYAGIGIELQEDGVFYGWRRATNDEANFLMLQFGLYSARQDHRYDRGLVDAIDLGISFLGDTWREQAHVRGFWGAVEQPNIGSLVYYIGGEFEPLAQRLEVSINSPSVVLEYTSFSRYNLGHYLVRSTSVPEPSTLAIFALGMIGLIQRQLKK